MRKSFYLYGCISFVLVYLLASCKSTLIVQVKHPGFIDIPANLDTIVIVDRTGLERGQGRKLVSVLEGMSSGEPILGDKNGVRATKMELVKIIQEHERLTLATFDIPQLNIAKLGEIEKPLTKQEVDSICKQYQANGILSLEFFDSQRIYHMNPNTSTQNQKSAHVYTQWRLYYNNTNYVVDYMDMTTFGTHYQTLSGIGTGQYKAIEKAGMEAADRYVKRIVPSYYRESRVYFSGGSKELRQAAKAMKNQVYEQAENFYLMILDNEQDPKMLGKAAFNMALIREMQERFEEAISYGNQAFQSGNKEAARYLNILRTRLNEQSLIELQMKRE
jgi:tetratricopeptide (TPR) repeat protein